MLRRRGLAVRGGQHGLRVEARARRQRGQGVAVRLRKRVADELTTTFASNYTDELSLSDALKADVVAKYNAKTTGQKYLICPQKPI